MTTRGTYIAFEGLEGCGKSTHVTRLAEKINAVATREPGGTRIGALLRGILADPENTDLDSRTELLLMTADRAQHMSELIERLKRDRPEALTAMNDQPSAYLAAPPEAMARLLNHVNSEFGSMTGYVKSIGIEADVIERLSGSLLQ